MKPLTERQRQMVFLLAQGFTYDEMGALIGISGKTAQQHCDRLRKRFGCSKRQIPAAYWKATGENPWPTSPTASLDYVELSTAA